MGSPFDFSSLSTTVNYLPETNIVEVARYGWGRQGLIPLWFGEGDVPTPAFISDACHESMIEGDTFYTDQNGITELREELIEYNKRTFDIRLNQDRVTVTNSGMMAITTVMQALLNPGDEVVVIGPVWPNIYSAISINRGIATHASITLQDNAWILDLKDVFAAISASTKAIFLNSPGNPTGWIMPEEDQKELLNFCREKGIWIVSDEVYHSLVFDRPVANSILKYASPNDKVISVNSFSKSWLMTGWRMGWIVHPVGLSETFAKLIQISTSGVPAFIQKAGIAALSKGDQVVSDLRDRCQIGRDIVFDYLEQWPRVRCMRPKGAFYAFFSVEGMENSLEFCKTLIDKCNVGLAPGSAFGPGGEGFLRLCFASTPDKLNEAMKALGKEIGGR
ncbi:MAG: aspartate aminotransferase [Rhodospirillaceae bacterium]|nr:aspartate aminotransferase [Rhodospirillaceae bacterium]|tara:strand:+ start:46 stop:1221 length:1176 start_codon:yes stop_codon:yes gene_type:complete